MKRLVHDSSHVEGMVKSPPAAANQSESRLFFYYRYYPA